MLLFLTHSAIIKIAAYSRRVVKTRSKPTKIIIINLKNLGKSVSSNRNNPVINNDIKNKYPSKPSSGMRAPMEPTECWLYPYTNKSNNPTELAIL
ncbi:hypothetical protein JCM12294_41730 [Desulfocicer niacini]